MVANGMQWYLTAAMSLAARYEGTGSCGGGGFLRRSMAAISYSPRTITTATNKSPLVSPWLKIPPVGGSHFYSLAENKVKSLLPLSSETTEENDILCIGSSHGWLVFQSRGIDRSIFLSNPITGHRINLPSIHSLYHPPDNVNKRLFSIRSIILSSCPNENDCRVVIIYYSRQGEKLAFCTTSGGLTTSTTWTCLPSPLTDYCNIVYSRNHQLFLALTEDLDMESWDLRDPFSPKRVVIEGLECEDVEEEWGRKERLSVQHNYLVPDDSSSNGDLFFIHRYVAEHVQPDGSVVDPTESEDHIGEDLPYKTWKFQVFKFDLTDKQLWYLDDSLEARAIFIGLNQSFLVSAAADFHGLIPNSIYFADDYPLIPDRSFGGHDVGIYNYKDKTLKPCYFPCDPNNIKRIEPCPLWFTPN
ncbi:hypothetical protein ACH5RR_039884 [Cinchona calisaya]|uniref:KIB1-4 beta-propeller domain-containing protein n=1 Tax=Cinchona calisaya TaxID=153742 RepID=A0ABD2Y184_9GENT